MPSSTIAELYPQAGMYSAGYISDEMTGSRTINYASIAYSIIASKMSGYDGAKLYTNTRLIYNSLPSDLDSTAWYKKGYRLGSYRFSAANDNYPSGYIDRPQLALPTTSWWINLRTDIASRWIDTVPIGTGTVRWVPVCLGTSKFTNVITNSTETLSYFEKTIPADKVEIITQATSRWLYTLQFIYELYKLPPKDSFVNNFILMPF